MTKNRITLTPEELDSLAEAPDLLKKKLKNLDKEALKSLVLEVYRYHGENYRRRRERILQPKSETRVELYGEPLAYVDPPGKGGKGTSNEGWNKNPEDRETLTFVDAVDDVIRLTFNDEAIGFGGPRFRVVLDQRGVKKLIDSLTFVLTQVSGDTLQEFEECCHAPEAEKRLQEILYEGCGKPE